MAGSVADNGSLGSSAGVPQQLSAARAGFFDYERATTCLDRVGLQLIRSIFGTLALLTRQQADVTFVFLII